MTEIERYFTGVLLDERLELGLGELCRLCGVSAEEIMDMVAEGILEPHGAPPRDWRFPGIAVVRVKKTLHLQRDLRVNLAGAALALELLDELETLRCRIRDDRF
jgi:chaperone modulatory protein CbpM